MTNEIGFQLVWGCDPSRQFESGWIRHLLASSILVEIELWHPGHFRQFSRSSLPTILVESGLLHLERDPSQNRIEDLINHRLIRQSLLSSSTFIKIIHLSDEEGNDADIWYPILPSCSIIWRNFYHPRLLSFGHNVRTFPIGPRALFIDTFANLTLNLPARSRTYPWAFMGTLWPSGSRKLAVSTFLSSLPHGYYFGGRSFGQGLPLEQYCNILLDSYFSLSPEGDRHLDTFRLWESLCCGCLPLVVDFNNSASSLLTTSYPLPIFQKWSQALDYATYLLNQRDELIRSQNLIIQWWSIYIDTLRVDLLSS